MDRQGRMEKKNKIKTLGIERCENIDTLYINIYVVRCILNKKGKQRLEEAPLKFLRHLL